MHGSIKLGDLNTYIAKAFNLANGARSRRVKGQTKQVIHDLKECINEFDNDARLVALQETFCRDAVVKLLCSLGRSYGENQQNDLAEDVFKRAIKLAPQDEFIWHSIAGYYKHAVANSDKKPLGFYDFALALTNNETSAMVGCGIAYYGMATRSEKDGQTQKAYDEKAISFWKNALAKEPNSTPILFLLAKAHYLRGDDGIACQYLRTIMKSEDMPEAIAMFLAAAPKDSPFVKYLQRTRVQDIEALQAMADSLQRDPLRIWTLQQTLKQESALSDGIYRTVWATAERLGLARLRPANEGAKSGVVDIHHRRYEY